MVKIKYYKNPYHPGISCLKIGEILIQEVPSGIMNYTSSDISELKRILVENWDDKNRCWKKRR